MICGSGDLLMMGVCAEMMGRPGEIGGGECVYGREPGIGKWKTKRQFIKFSSRYQIKKTMSICKVTTF